MNPRQEGQVWEARLQAAAREFHYPATPDLAAAMKRPPASRWQRQVAYRRWTWAAAVLFVLLAGLLAVPQVRAGLVEFLQLGAVRVQLIDPASTETPTPPASPSAVVSSPAALETVLDLVGETTLEQARSEAGFPIRLPVYPAELGEPDRVFLQDLGGPAVILVWLEPGQPAQVRMSLHALGPGAFVSKGPPSTVAETTVDGRQALWTEGPYFVQVGGGDYGSVRLVDGHVLIWVEGEITYRLESDLPLKEAVQVAESLQPSRS